LSAVVDASVMVAALLDAGRNGAWAEEVLAAGPVYSPELVWAETTNILRRLEGANQIATAEANAAQEELMQLDLETFPSEPFAPRIWQLRHNVTSYDAWYVALAESLIVPLATVDEKLAKTKGVFCRFLTPGGS
jgi:predicted nucleic acid-binding protein